MDDYSGVSVKVVNITMNLEYSEWTRAHFRKDPNRYDCNCVAVLYRGPWLRRAKIITVCFFATQSRSWKYRAVDVDVNVY